MQQRVGLARAFAAEPELMLYDEPFSALDPLIRRDMQDEVVRLQAETGKTMVFITHDLPEALRLGDRIAIMRDAEPGELDGPRVDVATTVRRAVPVILASEKPVCAVDGDRVVGVVDRDAALAAIAGEG